MAISTDIYGDGIVCGGNYKSKINCRRSVAECIEGDANLNLDTEKINKSKVRFIASTED